MKLTILCLNRRRGSDCHAFILTFHFSHFSHSLISFIHSCHSLISFIHSCHVIRVMSLISCHFIHSCIYLFTFNLCCETRQEVCVDDTLHALSHIAKFTFHALKHHTHSIMSNTKQHTITTQIEIPWRGRTDRQTQPDRQTTKQTDNQTDRPDVVLHSFWCDRNLRPVRYQFNNFPRNRCLNTQQQRSLSDSYT